MFEVKKTVTRTYIIRPPASGPIEASYAIYAHWAPPITTPVTNPATDFGPEANSPMPYEFSISHDAPIDPDAPGDEQAKHIHWHIKTWSIGCDHWMASQDDLLSEINTGGNIKPHPSGIPDDYWLGDCDVGCFNKIDGASPGTWQFVFRVQVFDPTVKNNYGQPLGTDYYIKALNLGAYDGKW